MVDERTQEPDNALARLRSDRQPLEVHRSGHSGASVGEDGCVPLQHAVTFPDGVTLTRLPIGRAAGHLWISFVAVRPRDADEWDIWSHINVEDAQCLEGGGSHGDGIEQMQFRYADPGTDSVTITYRTDQGELVFASEVVELPPRERRGLVSEG